MTSATSATHIRVGYLSATWGDITLDAQARPRYHGADVEALRALYESVLQQPYYRNLTPPQILARMAVKLSGPVWAVVVGEDGQLHG